jgi:hypothetical protein
MMRLSITYGNEEQSIWGWPSIGKSCTGQLRLCGKLSFTGFLQVTLEAHMFDRAGAITLKLQGLPRMSVPACVSKARANQFSNPKVYLKSLVERDLQGRWRELCTR